MKNLISYSNQALSYAIRGEFEQLSLKIEMVGEYKKYTLLTSQELENQGKIARIARWVTSLCACGTNVSWGTAREIKAFCKNVICKRLEENSKNQAILRKFLALARNGCLLDRKYEEELPHLHPKAQGLSLYHRELMKLYEKHCLDPALDMVSWYKTDEGRALLLKEKDNADIDMFRISYLSKEERAHYAVEYRKTPDGNVALFLQGKPLRTVSAEEKTSENSLTIFVMGHDGEVYIGPHEIGVFQHSSFFCGLPVISAGEIITDAEGKIIYLSNQSGHYKPSPRSTLSLLAKLQKRGVDLAGITLLMHTPPFDNQRKRGRFNALAYLQSQGECLPLSNGVYIQLKDGSLQPDLLMLT